MLYALRTTNIGEYYKEAYVNTLKKVGIMYEMHYKNKHTVSVLQLNWLYYFFCFYKESDP